MRCPPHGLYLITRETSDTAALLRVVGAALDGGAVMVQFRDKSDERARREAQARALLALCRPRGVPLVINDDVALAREIAADGVHVGEHDAAVAEARAALGTDAIVGVSCYDRLDLAAVARDAGASYVAFGSFFDSTTKSSPRRPAPTILGAAAPLGLPRVAIGGITSGNGGPLVAAGADLLAVISDVFDAPDPRIAAARYGALWRTG